MIPTSRTGGRVRRWIASTAVAATLIATGAVSGLAAASAVPAAAAASPDFNLPFDGSLTNTTGNPPAVTMGAGTASYTTGADGQAITLDRNDYVQVDSTAAPFDYQNSFSMWFWVKMNSKTGTSDAALLGNENWGSGNNPGIVFHTSGGNYNFHAKDPSSSRADVSIAKITTGQWDQIAATFDFSSGTINLYFDGQPVTTDTSGNAVSLARSLSDLAGAGPFLLGNAYNANDGSATYNSATNDNNLSLDDFVMTPSLLSAGDVKTSYDNVHDQAPFTVTALNVSPKTLRIEQGETQPFTAEATGTGTPKQDVTWSVTGGTGSTAINSAGVLSVDPAQAVGSTLTVTAASDYNSSATDSATVTVDSARTDGDINFASISDVHEASPENIARANKAFSYFSDPSLNNDALVLDGDLTSDATWSEFDAVRTSLAANLHIPLLANLGNHEYSDYADFTRATGDEPNYVQVIDGYYFIMLSPGAGTLGANGVPSATNNAGYSYLHDWVMQQVAIAEAASPDKPIFVFQHHPISNTVYVSDQQGVPDMSGWFTGHPRVVDISGHIHSPNNDPTSIWQDGGYTEVNDAATCSFDLEDGLTRSGGEPASTQDGSQGIEVSADASGNVEIKTRDLISDTWVQDWKFNVNQTLPYTSANRTPQAQAPVFDSGQQVRASDLDATTAHINFDQATEPQAAVDSVAQDGIHDYLFTLTDDATGKVVQQFRDWSDYWINPMPSTIDEDLSGLTKSTEYTITVAGEDHYGLTGTSTISTTFTTTPKEVNPHKLMDYAVPLNGSLTNEGGSPDPVMYTRTNAPQDTGQQQYVTGKDGQGQAMAFDDNHFVEIDQNDNIDYTQSFSVAFWMNVTAVRGDGQPGILSDQTADDYSQPGYAFRTNKHSDGTVWLEFDFTPPNGTEKQVDLAPITNSSWTQVADPTYPQAFPSAYWLDAPAGTTNWMHVAATFDTANNLVTEYVNGNQVGQQTDDLSGGIGVSGGDGTGNNSTFLGSSPWSYTFEGGYNGSGTDAREQIDFDAQDLVLQGTVYSQSQIQSLMNNFESRPATHTTTFDLNGGTSDPAPAPQTVFDGVKLIEPAPPTRTGYTFQGWYSAATGGTQWDFDNDRVTADTTLYAQFAPNTYTIHYDAGGGTGTTADSPATYDKDATLTANGFTRTGYTFAGWNTAQDGSGTSYADGATVSNLTADAGGNVTLYAQWKPITYTISYQLNGGTGSSSNPSTYTIESAPITLTNPTRDGYTFAGWTGPGYSDPATAVTIPTGTTGDLSFAANWTLNAPVLAFTTPAANATVSGTVPVTVSLTGAELEAYNLRIDSSGLQYAYQPTAGAQSFQLDTTTLSNGIHTLLATATDSAGDKTTITEKITVDNPPAVTFTTPADGARVSGTIPVVVQVTGQDLAAYNLRVDSSGLAYANPVTSGAQSFQLDTTTLSNGTHTLLATATDSLGGKTTVTEKITVDNPNPWAAGTTYQAGATVTYKGAVYQAAWSTKGETPGSNVNGAWEQQGELTLTTQGNAAAWTASWIYNGGETVAYNGALYKAAWYTRDSKPGDPDGAWEQIGAPVATDQGTFAAWTASWIYNGGETVAYNGHLYKAQWYSRNQTPGTAGSAWQDLGAYGKAQ
ncbi:InlB B-repeat-containing protein [Gryllotalpicola reticulitermitis]|uniref:InlB B-repeat-containing protein n=1 Tax=Gryllotalpicola reticulitermitis TaxID=1184153 RepID=A0ABV8Q5Y4_9MICO